MKKIVIIGGGVAGLCALNRLLDLGISATLIEAGSYPSHKICGEFFSPEALPILAAWDLEPTTKIEKISLISDKSRLSFSLPSPAGSQSRFDFDQRLVDRAEKMGGTIITKTKVQDICTESIILENGTSMPYSELIVSSGRLFGASPHMEYIGFKGHFKGIENLNGLEMFMFTGGYAGLSPIDHAQANFACLLRLNHFDKDKWLLQLFEQVPLLRDRLQTGELLFNEWLSCQVPNFGIKKNPIRPHTYFVGDAAGVIPPASGLGLSLAISSGWLAAEYAACGDYTGFSEAWKKKYRKIFAYGHCLHKLFMAPKILPMAMMLGRLFPKLPRIIFSKTRRL